MTLLAKHSRFIAILSGGLLLRVLDLVLSPFPDPPQRMSQERPSRFSFSFDLSDDVPGITTAGNAQAKFPENPVLVFEVFQDEGCKLWNRRFNAVEVRRG